MIARRIVPPHVGNEFPLTGMLGQFSTDDLRLAADELQSSGKRPATKMSRRLVLCFGALVADEILRRQESIAAEWEADE